MPGRMSGRDTSDRVFGSAEESTESASLFSEEQKQDFGPDYQRKWIDFHANEEISPYAEQMRARYAMDKRKRTCIILAVAFVILLALVVVLPMNVIQPFQSHGFAWWFDLLRQNVAALFGYFSGVSDNDGIELILVKYIMIAIAGAGLAMTGAIYQGVMRNALASPSTLGVMNGGTLGTIVYTLLFGVLEGTIIMRWSDYYEQYYSSLNFFDYFLAVQGRALCSLIGCFVVVMLTLSIAFIAGKGKVSKTGLIIAGQVFSITISGVISIIRYWLTYTGGEEQLTALAEISSGGMTDVFTWYDVICMAIPVFICMLLIILMLPRLNILAFNDEEARSMGLSVARSRILLIAVCTIMTAVIISFCGNIGFVGFMVPHITRRLVGPDAKYLVPASAFIGASYLLVTQHITQLGNFLNGSLGTLTTLVGIVMFVVVVIKQRKQGNAAWTS